MMPPFSRPYTRHEENTVMSKIYFLDNLEVDINMEITMMQYKINDTKKAMKKCEKGKIYTVMISWIKRYWI